MISSVSLLQTLKTSFTSTNAHDRSEAETELRLKYAVDFQDFITELLQVFQDDNKAILNGIKNNTNEIFLEIINNRLMVAIFLKNEIVRVHLERWNEIQVSNLFDRLFQILLQYTDNEQQLIRGEMHQNSNVQVQPTLRELKKLITQIHQIIALVLFEQMKHQQFDQFSLLITDYFEKNPLITLKCVNNILKLFKKNIFDSENDENTIFYFRSLVSHFQNTPQLKSILVNIQQGKKSLVSGIKSHSFQLFKWLNEQQQSAQLLERLELSFKVVYTGWKCIKNLIKCGFLSIVDMIADHSNDNNNRIDLFSQSTFFELTRSVETCFYLWSQMSRSENGRQNQGIKRYVDKYLQLTGKLMIECIITNNEQNNHANSQHSTKNETQRNHLQGLSRLFFQWLELFPTNNGFAPVVIKFFLTALKQQEQYERDLIFSFVNITELCRVLIDNCMSIQEPDCRKWLEDPEQFVEEQMFGMNKSVQNLAVSLFCALQNVFPEECLEAMGKVISNTTLLQFSTNMDMLGMSVISKWDACLNAIANSANLLVSHKIIQFCDLYESRLMILSGNVMLLKRTLEIIAKWAPFIEQGVFSSVAKLILVNVSNNDVVVRVHAAFALKSILKIIKSNLSTSTAFNILHLNEDEDEPTQIMKAPGQTVLPNILQLIYMLAEETFEGVVRLLQCIQSATIQIELTKVLHLLVFVLSSDKLESSLTAFINIILDLWETAHQKPLLQLQQLRLLQLFVFRLQKPLWNYIAPVLAVLTNPDRSSNSLFNFMGESFTLWRNCLILSKSNHLDNQTLALLSNISHYVSKLRKNGDSIQGLSLQQQQIQKRKPQQYNSFSEEINLLQILLLYHTKGYCDIVTTRLADTNFLLRRSEHLFSNWPQLRSQICLTYLLSNELVAQNFELVQSCFETLINHILFNSDQSCLLQCFTVLSKLIIDNCDMFLKTMVLVTTKSYNEMSLISWFVERWLLFCDNLLELLQKNKNEPTEGSGNVGPKLEVLIFSALVEGCNDNEVFFKPNVLLEIAKLHATALILLFPQHASLWCKCGAIYFFVNKLVQFQNAQTKHNSPTSNSNDPNVLINLMSQFSLDPNNQLVALNNRYPKNELHHIDLLLLFQQTLNFCKENFGSRGFNEILRKTSSF